MSLSGNLIFIVVVIICAIVYSHFSTITEGWSSDNTVRLQDTVRIWNHWGYLKLCGTADCGGSKYKAMCGGSNDGTTSASEWVLDSTNSTSGNPPLQHEDSVHLRNPAHNNTFLDTCSSNIDNVFGHPKNNRAGQSGTWIIKKKYPDGRPIEYGDTVYIYCGYSDGSMNLITSGYTRSGCDIGVGIQASCQTGSFREDEKEWRIERPLGWTQPKIIDEMMENVAADDKITVNINKQCSVTENTNPYKVISEGEEAINIEYKVKCCGIGLGKGSETGTVQRCAPFCPEGKDCAKLMKDYCVSGSNKFNDSGRFIGTDAGKGRFFNEECSVYMRENPDIQKKAIAKLCEKGDNWKSSACQTFCHDDTNKSACNEIMKLKCAQPEQWDTQECKDWCNKGCETGHCENRALCDFVEKPENCGTKQNPGEKANTAACACYTDLTKRPNYEDVGPAMNDLTSCIDTSCKGYMSRACPNKLVNCVQNYSQKYGVASDVNQNLQCGGDDGDSEEIKEALQYLKEKDDNAEESGVEIAVFDESDDDSTDDEDDELLSDEDIDNETKNEPEAENATKPETENAPDDQKLNGQGSDRENNYTEQITTFLSDNALLIFGLFIIILLVLLIRK